ncbi:MAG TPA: hypothetical protein H9743_03550 [Candidatus Mediterraneibacter vanvlietii]|nr:hypothetical protein [Candidatus Mediterraneibacter vanvlietii]
MKISIVKDFFEYYGQNNLTSFKNLDEEVQIRYSTLGEHRGRENVIRALRTEGEYGSRYTVMSNPIEYKLRENEVVIVNAFHYFVKIVKNQYSPFIAGGKYKFLFDGDRIKSIAFDLEAEMGNTYLAKSEWKWHMLEETKNNRFVKLDNAVIYGKTEEEEIVSVIYSLFLIADTGQYEMADRYICSNAVCRLARTTYSEQFGLTGDSQNTVLAKEYIRNNKKLEDQNHHSCHICEIKRDGSRAEVMLEMFEPTKLGFKHFDALSVYKPYYNEQWDIQLIKEECWKVKSMSYRPISRFETVGYSVLGI